MSRREPVRNSLPSLGASSPLMIRSKWKSYHGIRVTGTANALQSGEALTPDFDAADQQAPPPSSLLLGFQTLIPAHRGSNTRSYLTTIFDLP